VWGLRIDVSNPAEGYESYMVPALFSPWASKLIEMAGPKAGERVLDVGCGTGIVSRQAAVHVGPTGTVIGIDRNPNMLAVARKAAAHERAPIQWYEGRAERLPFTDGAFDLVVSQFAFMFFDDRPAAMAEIRRVLASGGRVLASVWQGMDRHPFYRLLHDVMLRREGRSVLQDVFALGDAEELRALAEGVGLRRIEITSTSITSRFTDPDAFLAAEVEAGAAAIPSMQQLDLAARRRLVAAISSELRPALARLIDDGDLVLEFHAHILKAWR